MMSESWEKATLARITFDLRSTLDGTWKVLEYIMPRNVPISEFLLFLDHK